MENNLKECVEKALTIEDLADSLELLLDSGCVVRTSQNGQQSLLETRELVERVNGLKIHIFGNEHAPPHFHVQSAEINAAFAIRDCALLEGTVDSKTKKLIVYWHRMSIAKLVEVWNRTRPTDCPVGPIKL
jgi:Domain of unknown function (DUF4160)